MSKLLSIMSYMGTLLYNVEQSIFRLVAQPSSYVAAYVCSDLELNFHVTLGPTFVERSGNVEPNVHADVRPTFRQPSGNVEPNVHADVRPTFRQGSSNGQPNVHADVRETFRQPSDNVEPNVHADVRPTFTQRSGNIELNVHADVRPTFRQRFGTSRQHCATFRKLSKGSTADRTCIVLQHVACGERVWSAMASACKRSTEWGYLPANVQATLTQRSSNVQGTLSPMSNRTSEQRSEDVAPNVHADVRRTFRQRSGNVQATLRHLPETEQRVKTGSRVHRSAACRLRRACVVSNGVGVQAID